MLWRLLLGASIVDLAGVVAIDAQHLESPLETARFATPSRLTGDVSLSQQSLLRASRLLHGFLERVAVPFSNKSIGEVEVTSFKISARRFIRDDEGAALAEYGILVAFIAIVAITAVTFFGSKISAKFSSMAGSFT